MTEFMSIDELEVSVRTFELLQESGISTVGELLATDVSGWSAACITELREALSEHDIVWNVKVPAVAPFVPPGDRAVPSSRIAYSGSLTSEPTSRTGGLPSAPAQGGQWPEGMKFLFQLTGVDLGLPGIAMVQAFADMTSDYYDPSCHRIVVYREPCSITLDPPKGVVSDPIGVMELTPSNDDSILADGRIYDDDALAEAGVDKDYAEAARSHAWGDKIRGVPIGANLDPNQRDSRGQPMTCLLQLVKFDDWFLWYLFANGDASELKLEIVRG